MSPCLGFASEHGEGASAPDFDEISRFQAQISRQLLAWKLCPVKEEGELASRESHDFLIVWHEDLKRRILHRDTNNTCKNVKGRLEESTGTDRMWDSCQVQWSHTHTFKFNVLVSLFPSTETEKLTFSQTCYMCLKWQCLQGGGRKIIILDQLGLSNES